MATFGETCAQPPHRSFWRDGLVARAGGRPLDEWLVEQANLRGFYGAFGPGAPAPSAADPDLGLEDIVCGLLLPHGPADGRLFKLVLRILQSGRVDPARLALLARRERADHVLVWLLGRVPAPERNASLDAVATALGTPRGHRPPRMEYDANRLLRRPHRSAEAPWTRRRGSS